ncbi:malto-oligosyltrehalose synthase [Actinomarinicola tropica]|uniref:Malto-oligosyltrehalose synthase n=1 Tax=Actinomarinicola tropica TaxID=2789776 RepID=A0A5Q2RKE1_9ACTN|nr:malto-oligosyltrehalose synthase [Actinomarinicola tropica]QGG96303.1 malto-oligosyltrehalose synthase [Actinomarinicola tropica]
MPAPRATYRLQLRPDFGFDDAADVADRLAELGVSHVYTSPYLQAAPGSTHGYDVVDHSRVNDELGGPEAHRRFVDRLGELGLAQVVDIVPNHMAIGSPLNLWWWDVLENGRSSRFAGHFDVDWDPPESKLRNRVLMPILGDQYGRVLERGEITLEWGEDARFRIRYFDHVLPVAPRTLDRVLLGAARRADGGTADRLAFIGHSFGRLPSATTTSHADVVTRHRDKEVLHDLLRTLRHEDPGARAAVEAEVASINDDVDALDDLLDHQNHRLAFWRTAGHDLDYRRFFDINSLVGLRVEDPKVFADTHQLVLRWLADGEVDGMRVDHPDGLRDPAAYVELLRAAGPAAWIVIEKILEPGEALPSSWPVDGTTGYDFCHVVTRLLHDPRGEAPVRALHAEVIGVDPDDAEEALAAVVHRAKHAVMRDSLAADLGRATELFVAVSEHHRRWRDFTRRDLHDALEETAACFSVYRTYVGEDGRCTPTDARVIEEALAEAAERRDDLDPEVFEFLGLVLRGDLEPGAGTAATELRMRFQQITGPVMAKGVEDTAFYDHVPLASLNEVGSDPSVFALEPAEVHAALALAADAAPRAMLALSTHDTKRSEDVRARLALLSEVPGAWSEAVRRWTAMAAPHRAAQDAPGWPDPRMEHLLWQTLVGAHPLGADRAVAYMEKAAKEAKRHTSWVDPVPAFDDALAAFVRAVCEDEELTADLAAFVEPLVPAGRLNALAQKLVQLTAPGVPDIYQGTELWDLSLVDPDNRRPVDHDLRRRLLSRARELTPEQRRDADDEGTPKLWVVHRALALRAERPEWFDGASYAPLAVGGAAAGHAFAYLRGGHAAAVVPRLPLGLEAAGGWQDTTVELPEGSWWDELGERRWDGGSIRLADLLERFPVALLRDDRGGTP